MGSGKNQKNGKKSSVYEDFFPFHYLFLSSFNVRQILLKRLDSEYAGVLNVLSTLVCIITMPVTVLLYLM